MESRARTPALLLQLTSVCLLLGLPASGSDARAACPTQCRCGPMSSDKTAQNWIIALSAHRHQRLIVGGPARNYHRADAGEAGYRQMTCVGLSEMPSSVPADVKKLMIYGDRYALPHRLLLHDHVKAGHIDWDKAFSMADGPTEHHQLKQLMPETFGSARELQELFIEGNDIQMLQPEALSALPQLRLLSFRKNRLKELGAESLKGLELLTDADFSSNDIQDVDSHAFSHVSNLRALSLSSNLISSIRSEHVSALVHLRDLDVSNNRLHTLDSHVFTSQRNLTVLNLSKNRIASLDNHCFDGLDSLKSLQLSGNGIHEIAKGAFASLASLQALDLSGNGLEQLTYDILTGMSRLEELNLERNYISSIEPLSFRDLGQLRVLKLGHNLLAEINPLTLTGLKALHVLRLENNAISVLDNAVLRTVPELRELVFAANRLTSIGKGTFRGLSYLRELRLERNQIKHIEDEAFAAGAMGQLSKLGWLFLDGNRLRAISPRTFLGVPYLRHLSVSANDLGIVDARALWHTRNLVTLVLADNRLAELSPGTFSRQRALRVLNVAGNDLTSIRSGSLAGLQSLEELLASGNRISAVSSDALADLAALTRLDFSKNALTAIDLDSLLNGTKLQYLDLSKNRIRVVTLNGGGSAAAANVLKSLNLADNALETLDEVMATSLANGSEFHLNGNPWRCDCRLLWLRQLIAASKTTLAHAEDVVCKAPGTLSGRQIEFLQPHDLACHQPDLLTPKRVGSLICSEPPEQLATTNTVRKRSRKDIQAAALTVFREGHGGSAALCHGFVLSSAWALTTASCWGTVSSYTAEGFPHAAAADSATAARAITIIIGAGSQTGRRAAPLLLKTVIPHPGFLPGTGEHDLAAVHFGSAQLPQSSGELHAGSTASSARGNNGSGGLASSSSDSAACILDRAQLSALVSRGTVAWAASKQTSSRRQDVEPVPFRITINEICSAEGHMTDECLMLRGHSLLKRRSGLHLDGTSLRYDLLQHGGLAGFYAPVPRSRAHSGLSIIDSKASHAAFNSTDDISFIPLYPYAEWLRQTMQEAESP